MHQSASPSRLRAVAVSGVLAVILMGVLAGGSVVVSERISVLMAWAAVCVAIPLRLGIRAILWSIFLVSFGRRLADVWLQGSNSSEFDYLILAPYVAIGVVGIRTMGGRSPFQPRGQRDAVRTAFQVFSLLGVISAGIGIFRFGEVGVYQALNLLAPIALLPIALSVGHVQVLQELTRFFRYSIPIALVYGYWQLVDTPGWDIAWLRSIQEDTVSFGIPEVGQFRIFGTFSAPLLFATFLCIAVLALWTLRIYSRPIQILLSIGLVYLVLETEIRTALVALIVAIGCAYAVAVRTFASVLLSVLTMAAAIWVIGPLASLLESSGGARSYSLSTLDSDRSWIVRLDLIRNTWTQAMNPIPRGVGSLNSGSRVFDNGFISTGIELGVLGLLSLLVICVVLISQVVVRSSSATPVQVYCALTVVFFVVSQFSAPVIQSLVGSFFWLTIGMAYGYKVNDKNGTDDVGPHAPDDLRTDRASGGHSLPKDVIAKSVLVGGKDRLGDFETRRP